MNFNDIGKLKPPRVAEGKDRDRKIKHIDLIRVTTH